MKKAIHILFVEGVPVDVVIMHRELRKAGLAFRSKVLETRRGFLHKRELNPLDVMLPDHCLPSFDGPTARAEIQNLNSMGP
jgi:two-component system response regulator